MSVSKIKIVEMKFLLVFAIAVPLAAKSPAPYNAYDGEIISARQSAMGGVGASGVEDVSTLFYNPAFLFPISKEKIFTISSKIRQTPKDEAQEILGGRALTFLGFASGGAAIAWQGLSNFEDNDNIDGSTVSIKVNRFTMGFSNALSPQVLIGMNVNYFNGFMGVTDVNKAEISDANGWGLDWGIIWKVHPSIQWGLGFFNYPASVRWSGYGSEGIPPILRIGAKVTLARFLEVSADMEQKKYKKPRDYDNKREIETYSIGIEQNIFDRFFLRGGMFGEDLDEAKKTGYSAGVGWSKAGTRVDVSWRKWFPTPESDYVNAFYASVSSPF